MPDIKLCEMYSGFDGEVNLFGQGTPTIFIRFQGCNLNCSWCDTKYARSLDEGGIFHVEQIVGEVKVVPGINKVTITGGEPMLQPKALKELVRLLFYEGYRISVETNGSKPWGVIDEPGNYQVHSWLVDYKLPSSTQHVFNHPLKYYAETLTNDDFVKFVIFLPGDIKEAVDTQLKLESMGCEARFAYSTTTMYVSPAELADQMLKYPEILGNAVFNLQIHKVVWPHQRQR